MRSVRAGLKGVGLAASLVAFAALGLGCWAILGIEDLSGDGLITGSSSSGAGGASTSSGSSSGGGSSSSGGGASSSSSASGTGGGAQVMLCDPGMNPCGKHVWSRRLGDAGEQHSRSIASTNVNDVVIVGSFAGTIDFTNNTLTTAGGLDVFIAKFSGVDGKTLWSKRGGDGLAQIPRAVAVDSNGAALVGGSFQGQLDMGDGPITSLGMYDIFVGKFVDPDGTQAWLRGFGGGGDEFMDGVAVDPLGNVVLTGYASGAINFGGGALQGQHGIFLAKLSSAGNHIWSKRFEGTMGEDVNAYGIAIDSGGNVIVAGRFGGTISFGLADLTSKGASDVFVAKFSSSGALLWNHAFGGALDQIATAVAVDPSDNVLVTGRYRGTLDLGATTHMSEGADDVFVAKLDANGAYIWSRSYGGATVQSATSIAADTLGNVSLSGNFVGSIDFGVGPVMGAGSDDIFLAKLTSSGKLYWSQSFGSLDAQTAVSVAVDRADNILLAGDILNAANLGGGVLTSMGSTDVVFGKFQP